METTFLYELIDPRTGKTRYVGKSDNPFERFKRHCWPHPNDFSPKTNWIRELRSLGLKPHMDLLDEVPKSQWKFWEREYIRVFRAINLPLLNESSGGDGPFGGPMSENRKKKIGQANRGKKHGPLSEETRKKISLANKGRTVTDEFRAKMSRIRKGKKLGPQSPEHKAAISAALKGKPISPKTLLGARKFWTGHHHSEETKQKISLTKRKAQNK